ncbi:undecaprenyl-diphosphate phosphatase [Paenibacillus sp. F411]|uniref:undecaprenyl-diphosphate phosphatase n=1 Tax=Paenibacillus sp. F411 TaxID=2820239 RepID=UPI001AAFB7C2|nr:undecaprenyl-diphosphate phosphatase [Paenibacillus sp. F411]MBO2942460.1 undecaprenyl-diphosphate phosphatase [Paenibacillus sp. F411]
MDILAAIILGIVEGLTEFIPVSSTGHMILTAKMMGYDDQTPLMKTFEVVIQLGAILAMAIVYWQRILSLLGFIDSKPLGKQDTKASRLTLMHVLLGIAPALLVAYVAKDHIKSLFSADIVLFSLVAGGIFMILAERFNRSKAVITAQELDGITLKQAFLIGLYQVISVLWPGFSRSGATISGGMLSGVSYKASADFSFLIAIPIMCAAAGYELLDSYRYFTADVMGVFAAGFIVSFVVAYLVILAFMKYIQRVRLTHFAIYRFILAALFWTFIMQ